MMRSMIRTPMTGNVTTVLIIVLRRTVIKLYPIGDQTCSFVLISSRLGAAPVKEASLGLYPLVQVFCMQVVVQVPHSFVSCHTTSGCKKFSTQNDWVKVFLHSWNVLLG